VSPRAVLRPAALAAAAVALFGAGWGAHAWRQRAGERLRERRVRLGGFRLVSPLLDLELPQGYGVEREPIPFRAKVVRFVDDQVRSGRVREMSVYYRDLMDGPWFGVNENRKYDPASMMKVPVMIAWLKRAEREPGVLQQVFVFDAAAYPGSGQALAPERTLAPGRRYTVEELLRFMLAYSDNRAMWLLFTALRPEELNDVLDSMDVTNDPADQSNSISVVGYSGFFRILFNASYLNREMSERALELLALQEFPDGIVAGVPKGTIVASKFGETAPARPGGELQLHEFGIVYAPSGPYILGVMTVGHDRPAQAGVLRDVSALIYSELASQAARWPQGGARQATRR
jgi:beta-lactamase class A